MSDWNPIDAPEGQWQAVKPDVGSTWSAVGDNGDCGEWDGIAGGGDCADWGAHLCWILDTGRWADACFWGDLKLWDDGTPFWGEVAA